LHETKMHMRTEREGLQQISLLLTRTSTSLFKEQRSELENMQVNILKDARRFLKTEEEQLKNTEKIIKLVDPMNVVKRGYTITSVNGNVVRSMDQVKAGDRLETLTGDGIIESQVLTTKKNNHE